MKSNNIGDASKIGLACPSGDIDDCNESLPINEHVPQGCEGVLIFSDNIQDNYTCGLNCGNKPTRAVQCGSGHTCGWTKFIRFVELKSLIFLICCEIKF